MCTMTRSAIHKGLLDEVFWGGGGGGPFLGVVIDLVSFSFTSGSNNIFLVV